MCKEKHGASKLKFGRDLGLVKETLVTIGKVCDDDYQTVRGFFASLAHQAVIANKTIGFVETLRQSLDWDNFYKTHIFGISTSKIDVPEYDYQGHVEGDFSRLIVVAERLYLERIVNVCRKHFEVHFDFPRGYRDCRVESSRKPEHGGYGVWIRDSVNNADNRIKGSVKTMREKSLDIKKEGHFNTMTLEERLLFGLKFYLENYGKKGSVPEHLDIDEYGTVCADSWLKKEGAPTVVPVVRTELSGGSPIVKIEFEREDHVFSLGYPDSGARQVLTNRCELAVCHDLGTHSNDDSFGPLNFHVYLCKKCSNVFSIRSRSKFPD